MPPGMAHTPAGTVRSIATICSVPSQSGCHRVTIGSAAWFGPHLPSSPRPAIPVLAESSTRSTAWNWKLTSQAARGARGVYSLRALDLPNGLSGAPLFSSNRTT